jgi:aspartokinase/homoserine dehydrogenase 1
MTTLVVKFGGTSVGTAKAIQQAAQVVLRHAPHWERTVVVVSAMAGVTDALIKGAQTAATGDEATHKALVADLRARHYRAIDELFTAEDARGQLLNAVDHYLDEYLLFCRSVQVLGEVTPRAMDAISSLGERMSARILAAVLAEQGAKSEAVDAEQLIVTDERFQQATPDMDASTERMVPRLRPLFDGGIVPVVTGFLASTPSGAVSTLGRGGSDFSATILGNCLDADEVWIMTDVDGIMTADPRWVPHARVIPTLSYNEVAELAYFGAKVLHPRTIRPVIDKNIPLWVKNTFNPDCAGTLVVRDVPVACGAVKAVTAINGLSMVTVEGRGMLGVPGIAARTFSAVASQGASVLMISQASSEQSICFVIRTDTVPAVISAVEQALALELTRRDVDRVSSLDHVVIVTAVGAGMRNTPGIAARIFGALGEAGVNVIAIAQGSSECSVSLVVANEDASAAVRCIHEGVILHA